MSDLFQRLLDRGLGYAGGFEPRLPARFEDTAGSEFDEVNDDQADEAARDPEAAGERFDSPRSIPSGNRQEEGGPEKILRSASAAPGPDPSPVPDMGLPTEPQDSGSPLSPPQTLHQMLEPAAAVSRKVGKPLIEPEGEQPTWEEEYSLTAKAAGDRRGDLEPAYAGPASFPEFPWLDGGPESDTSSPAPATPMPPPLAGRREPDHPPPVPPVEIRIGRIEVRAAPAEPAPRARRSKPTPPRESLAGYLSRRRS